MVQVLLVRSWVLLSSILIRLVLNWVQVNVEQVFLLFLDDLVVRVCSSSCLGLPLLLHDLWATLDGLATEVCLYLILLDPLQHLPTLQVAQCPALEHLLLCQQLLDLLLEAVNDFQNKELLDGRALPRLGSLVVFVASCRPSAVIEIELTRRTVVVEEHLHVVEEGRLA